MKTKSFIAMTLLVVAFACKNESQQLVKKLDSSYDYDGKEITLEGYVMPPFAIAFVHGHATQVNLCSSDDVSRNRTIITNALTLNFGKGANSIFFEDNAKADQIAIYDQTGALITHHDKVKVTGKIHYMNKGPKKKVDGRAADILKKIKAQNGDVQDNDGNDYTYEITAVNIVKL